MIALLLILAVQDTTIVIHPDSSGVSLEALALPRVVSDEVIRFYNAPGTTRLVGRTRLPRGNEWRGDVAVRNGPVFIAGRVQGTLVVINGDLQFEPGAEVSGNVIVTARIRSYPAHQYDQAGLMVRFSSDCWLKTSVEFEPDSPSQLGAGFRVCGTFM